METDKFNSELVKRFVNDEKLPIQVIKYVPYFEYMLDLFESTHKTRTKWENWQRVIRERFDNDPEAYLNSFYKMRDNIITTMKANEDYIRFNNCDMNQYRVTDIPQVGSGAVYKVSNSGKYYLSIDLKKANYQALHYAGVIKENSYDEWIRTFTDLDHLAESKYLRVVVFGQLNPGRHITLEKYITANIFKSVNDIIAGKVVSIANDEVIWEMDGGFVTKEKQDNLRSFIKEKLGFDVTVESFRLQCLKLVQETEFGLSKSLEFYRKDMEECESTYHCIPNTYYPIILKLLSHTEEIPYDRWFEHDGMLSQFIGSFKLEEI